SIGHVRDLPKSNKDAVDIENGFKPKYVAVPKKKDVISELGTLAQKANEVILSTDPDREGEAIAWHLYELLTNTRGKTKVDPKKFKRVAFNEITESAIQEAFKHPRDIDIDL